MCIRPQNAYSAPSIFMIIFYWKQVHFHDHLVLENSPAVASARSV